MVKFDAFYRAVLQQAWAEGRDIHYGIMHGLLLPGQPSAKLLQAAIRLPWRHWNPEAVGGGGGQWLVHRTTRNPVIGQRVTQGWYGAELALRHCLGRPPDQSATWLHMMAHWHLYTRYAVTGPDFQTADALRSLVMTHPSDCQRSRGEQWILHRSEDASDWHPFREGTGAMRRAPWWGLVSLVPTQASARAYTDALWAYQGRAPALCAAVAWTVSCTVGQPPPSSRTLMHVFVTAIHRFTPRHAIIRTLVATLWRRMRYGVSFEEQCQWIAQQAHYFPYDHVVPNVLVQLLVLGYGTNQWSSTLDLLPLAGWDLVTNAIVVGTLLGLQGLAPVCHLELVDSDTAHAIRQLSKL
jgi:hypothetical protein